MGPLVPLPLGRVRDPALGFVGDVTSVDTSVGLCTLESS
jgi:hypothetical protein